jgi:hypothetical protein
MRYVFKNIVKPVLIYAYPESNIYNQKYYTKYYTKYFCIKCQKYNCYCFTDFDFHKDFDCCDRYYSCKDCWVLPQYIKKHDQKEEVFMI